MMNATLKADASFATLQSPQTLSLYETLLLDLRTYGLNPRHWKLKRNPTRPREVELNHRYDSDFKLNGRLKYLRSGAWKLEALELVSI